MSIFRSGSLVFRPFVIILLAVTLLQNPVQSAGLTGGMVVESGTPISDAVPVETGNGRAIDDSGEPAVTVTATATATATARQDIPPTATSVPTDAPATSIVTPPHEATATPTSPPALTPTGDAALQVALVPVSLTINNSAGPLTVEYGEFLNMLAVGLPVADMATLMQFDGAGCVGIGIVAGSKLTSASGSISWQIEVTTSGERSYLVAAGGVMTACVDVTVVDSVPPVLTIGNSAAPVAALGATLPVRLTGAHAGDRILIETFGLETCGTPGSGTVAIDVVSAGSTLDSSLTLAVAGVHALQATLPDDRVSNCVTVSVIADLDPVLRINGRAGLVSVEPGTTMEFAAGGLPGGVTVMLEQWIGSAVCMATPDASGPIPTDAGGTWGLVEAVPTEPITAWRIRSDAFQPPLYSNCVTVAAAPPAPTIPMMLINGEPGPIVDVPRSDRWYPTLVVTGWPGDDVVRLELYENPAQCGSGVPDEVSGLIDISGGARLVDPLRPADEPGALAYRLVSTTDSSLATACITMNVITMEHVPVVLRVNGQTGTLVLQAGETAIAQLDLPDDIATWSWNLGTGMSCAEADMEPLSAAATEKPLAILSMDSPNFGYVGAMYQLEGDVTWYPVPCVTIIWTDPAADMPALTVNGSDGPVYAEPGETFILAGGGFSTTGDQLDVHVAVFDSAQCTGFTFLSTTYEGVVSGDGGFQVTGWQPPDGWDHDTISVMAQDDDFRRSNCVDIVYGDAPGIRPSLTINNQAASLTVEPGTGLNVQASGFFPAADITPVRFDAAGCSGISTGLATITAGSDGTVSLAATATDTPGTSSWLMQTADQSTNCVDVIVDPAAPPAAPVLTANNSLGPVIVDHDDPVTLFGTGLPAEHPVILQRFGSAHCQGGSSEDATGESTASGTFLTERSLVAGETASFRIEAPASNCVTVIVGEAPVVPDPVLTVNNSAGPLTLNIGDTVNLLATGFVDVDVTAQAVTVTALRFTTADCRGTNTTIASGNTSPGGSFTATDTLTDSGTFGYQVTASDQVSNCVTVIVLGADPTATPTFSPTVTATMRPVLPGRTPTPTITPTATSVAGGGEAADTDPGSGGVTGLPSTGTSPGGGGVPVLLLNGVTLVLFGLAVLAWRRLHRRRWRP